MSFPDYVNDYKGSHAEHYVDTFATTYTPTDASTFSRHRSPTIQTWNIALRLMTTLFALAAVLCTIFAKAEYFGWTLSYTSSNANVFFLAVNAAAGVYGFVLAAIGIVMWFNGSSKPTPPKLMIAVLVLDVVGVVFLLLGFAAALATQVITRKGYYVISSQEVEVKLTSGICNRYGDFCTVFEVALGFCGVTIVTFMAGTALDAHSLHLR